MQAGRRRPTVPVQLGVVVRMRVDEPRRHEQSIGVEHRLGGVADSTDFDDAATIDPDVGHIGRTARAVDDRPAFDYVVKHVPPSPRSPRHSIP